MNRNRIRAWTVVFLAMATLGFDMTPHIVPPSEILSGGPPKDGIPALDDPAFVAAGNATFLNTKSPVIGVVVNGEAKAYPISILNWHEVVNDTVGGVPIAVTY